MSQRIAYLEAVIGADITNFRREMRNVRGDLGILSDQLRGMRALGRNLTFAVTIPLLAIGSAAVKSAGDFEGAMRNVNSIAQLTENGFKNLSQEVLAFGTNTRAGPVGAAEALYTVFSAGITDTAMAMKIMSVATKTAEAGLADISVTTEALTAAMLAYGASTDDASRYSDILTQTVAVGVGSMDQFTGAIGMAVPTAKILGVQFEEVGGALAFLTQRGFSASASATRLKGVLGKLLKPTDAMSAAFGELGVASGSQLIEKFGGLEGALVALGEVAGDSETKLFNMFNEKRAFEGAASFIGSIEAFNASMDEFHGKLDGATERAWEQQMMSFPAQFDKLKSAVTATGIALGQQLLPILTPVISKFTELFIKASTLSPDLLRIAVAAAAAATALGPLLWILSGIMSPIALVIGASAALYKAIKEDWGGIGTTIGNAVAGIVSSLQPVIDAFNEIKSILYGEDSQGPTYGPHEANPMWDQIDPGVDMPTASQGVVLSIPVEAEMTLSHLWYGEEGIQQKWPNQQDFYDYMYEKYGDFGGMITGNVLEIPLEGEAQIEVQILDDSFIIDPEQATSRFDSQKVITPGMGEKLKTAMSKLLGELGKWVIQDGVPMISKAMGYMMGRVVVEVVSAIGGIWDMIFSSGAGGDDAGAAASYVGENVIGSFADGVKAAASDYAGTSETPFEDFAKGLFTLITTALVMQAGVTQFGKMLIARGFKRGIVGTLFWVLSSIAAKGAVLLKTGAFLIMGKITSFFIAAMNAFHVANVAISQAIYGFLSKAVFGVISLLSGIQTAATLVMVGVKGFIINAAVTVFSFATGIATVASATVGWIVKGVMATGSLLMSAGQFAFSVLGAIFGAMTWGAMFAGLTGIAIGVLIWAIFKDELEDVKNFVLNEGIPMITGAFSDLASAAASAVSNAFKGLKEELKGILTDIGLIAGYEGESYFNNENPGATAGDPNYAQNFVPGSRGGRPNPNRVAPVYDPNQDGTQSGIGMGAQFLTDDNNAIGGVGRGPMWVGEQGPEVIIPGSSSRIIPNSALRTGSRFNNQPAMVSITINEVSDIDHVLYQLRRRGIKIGR